MTRRSWKRALTWLLILMILPSLAVPAFSEEGGVIAVAGQESAAEPQPQDSGEPGGISRVGAAGTEAQAAPAYTEIFVSAKGSDDSGSGSLQAPFASLAKAAAAAQSAPTQEVYICVLSDLTLDRTARFGGKNITLMGVGGAWVLQRAESFAAAEDAVRGAYNPALIELGSLAQGQPSAGTLTVENLILDDVGRHMGTLYQPQEAQSANPAAPTPAETPAPTPSPAPAEPPVPSEEPSVEAPADDLIPADEITPILPRGDSLDGADDESDDAASPEDPAITGAPAEETPAPVEAPAEETPAPTPSPAPAQPSLPQQPNLSKVQDAIIAVYRDGALILSAGAELRNFGGLSAVRLSGVSKLSMEAGSAIRDTRALNGAQALSAIRTENESTAVLYDGALIREREGAAPSRQAAPQQSPSVLPEGDGEGPGITNTSEDSALFTLRFDSAAGTSIPGMSSAPGTLTEYQDNLGFLSYTINYTLSFSLAEEAQNLIRSGASAINRGSGTIKVTLDSRLDSAVSGVELSSPIFELTGEPTVSNSVLTAEFSLKSDWSSHLDELNQSMSFRFSATLPRESFTASTVQKDQYIVSTAVITLELHTARGKLLDLNSPTETAKTKMLSFQKNSTLSYNVNGGDLSPVPPMETSLAEQQAYPLATTPEPTHAPVNNADVVFLGWTAQADSHIYADGETGPALITETPIHPNTNEVVYAAWGYDENSDGIADIHQRLVTLSFDANGGSGAPAPITEAAKADAGVSIPIPEKEPVRSYYHFDGWSKDASATDGEYKHDAERASKRDLLVVKDTTLYAVWKENYKLYYDANGGTNAPPTQTLPSQTPSGTSASGRTIYTGRVVISSQQPTRVGYIFKGWATTRRGAAEYFGGDEAEISGGNVTLYAVWARDPNRGSTAYGDYSSGYPAGAAPRTGDSDQPLLYAAIALAALAAAGLAVIILIRKSRKK